MFFSRKDDKNEIRDIKDALEEEPAKIEKRYMEPVEMPIIEKETGAPLFVKVDKYREVIKSIQEMKLFVSSTKQVFVVPQEMETLRADALNVLRATMQRLERSIVEIDSELLRPYGVSMAETESSEVTHMEASLNELQKQLLELKRELQGMK